MKVTKKEPKGSFLMGRPVLFSLLNCRFKNERKVNKEE
jgi:hypothetical protein